MTIPRALLSLLVLALIAGCANQPKPSPSPPTALGRAVRAPLQREAIVVMTNDSQFRPRNIGVVPGQLIRWESADPTKPHTVTADGTNAAKGGPDSDRQFPTGLNKGQSYTWTVPKVPAGTIFYYHCRFHGQAGNGHAPGGGMSAAVTVR